ILAVLFLDRTTMGFQFQSVATLSDFLVAQFSVTYTQLGLLIGCYLLPGIVVAYPGGMLGKRWGDKQIAILGLTLMVVGGLVNGASDLFRRALNCRYWRGFAQRPFDENGHRLVRRP